MDLMTAVLDGAHRHTWIYDTRNTTPNAMLGERSVRYLPGIMDRSRAKEAATLWQQHM